MSILKQKVKGAAKPLSVVTKPQLNVASVQAGLNPEFKLTETPTGYDVDVTYPISEVSSAPDLSNNVAITGTKSKISTYPVAYAQAPDDGWMSFRIDCSAEGLLIFWTSKTIPSAASAGVFRGYRQNGTTAQVAMPIKKGEYAIALNNNANATISSSSFQFFPLTKGTDTEYVSADTTFYVRTNGKDTNDGLTAATAVQTIEGLINKTRKYNFNNYNVTVDIGAGEFAFPELGTYTNIKPSDFVGVQSLTVKGDSRTTTFLTGIVSFFKLPYVTVRDLTIKGNRLCFTGCYSGVCTDVDHTNTATSPGLPAIIFYKTVVGSVTGTHRCSGQYAALVAANGAGNVAVSAAYDVSGVTAVRHVLSATGGGNITVASTASFTGTIQAGAKFNVERGSTIVCPVAIPAPDAGIIDASSAFSNAATMPTDLTQERIIGTLNGKPVYERTIQYTTSVDGLENDQQFDTLVGDTLPNVDTMLSLSGSVAYFNNGTYEQWLPLTFVNRPWINPSVPEEVNKLGNYFVAWFVRTTGKLRSIVKGTGYPKGTAVNATYRYTKTTD